MWQFCKNKTPKFDKKTIPFQGTKDKTPNTYSSLRLGYIFFHGRLDLHECAFSLGICGRADKWQSSATIHSYIWTVLGFSKALTCFRYEFLNVIKTSGRDIYRDLKNLKNN
jgi:hypothetical protein